MIGDSGQSDSLWHPAPAARGPLTQDTDADVCVAGAGMAGLSVAYRCLELGMSVVVLDDGPVGGGESGRTTAHLNSYLDDGLDTIKAIHGVEGLRQAVAAHHAGIEFIERVSRENGFDCDFRWVPDYYFVNPAGSGSGQSYLDKELQAARDIGWDAVGEAPKAPIPGVDTGRCLKIERQARFHASKYYEGISSAIEARGGRIFNRTRLKTFHGGDPADTYAETVDGHKVRCRHAVGCTNSPTGFGVATLPAIHARQAPYRTYVIGFHLRGELVRNGTIPDAHYTDTDSPYHYCRLHEDGKGDYTLIVGGEDHKTGHHNDTDARFKRLDDWAHVLWPMLGARTFEWSGQVMETPDGLAYIGRDPGQADNVYLVTGDSGQGMTHGSLAGLLIGDLITGRDNAWAPYFDPRRTINQLKVRAFLELLKENADVMLQYKDLVTRGADLRPEDLRPGEAAIVGFGTGKLAVYCDEGGTVHQRSAICPHMGCVVQWNSLEKSWDCPCHGSRFNGDPKKEGLKYGEQINAPAGSDLAGA